MKQQFQHTAARRRLVPSISSSPLSAKFQHTAARRRLASKIFNLLIYKACFNTQPPEGGWINRPLYKPRFNVSTHSRPKAAGYGKMIKATSLHLFQHTAARRRLAVGGQVYHVIAHVSTHSRPKAAGRILYPTSYFIFCFNTQPPEGGWVIFNFLFVG